jgi:hypothetical protein
MSIFCLKASESIKLFGLFWFYGLKQPFHKFICLITRSKTLLLTFKYAILYNC